MVAFAPVSGLTYDELRRWYPDDDSYRRELIDGELYVTPAPSIRHQRVVLGIARRLAEHADRHGGECFTGPLDMVLAPGSVPEADLLYLTAATRERLDPAKLVGPADLVVEVSSPSTRRADLLVKRDLYARFEVPDYWVVDLEQDAVVVHRLGPAGYADPVIAQRGTSVTSEAADGFTMTVDDLLGPPAAGRGEELEHS